SGACCLSAALTAQAAVQINITSIVRDSHFRIILFRHPPSDQKWWYPFKRLFLLRLPVTVQHYSEKILLLSSWFWEDHRQETETSSCWMRVVTAKALC
ncbi:MAG TPA: hypothetical protein DCE18_07745, partial [Syntrophobacteraceae bacterium]|nr:hypothetical protein [Syntrophobacteraceae bacterium]